MTPAVPPPPASERSTLASFGHRLATLSGLWTGLLLIVACMAFATYARLAQLSAWERDPAQYVAAGVPMMTTFDAYYSLRLARLHAEGKFVAHGPVPARHYSRPEIADPAILYDQREPQALPLLSRLLAVASSITGRSIDDVGLLMPPLLSSLFMVPLFLCCWRLGVPAAGVMGALVGSFCIDYYRRTSVGWVDTDCLNLFFPWTASLLVLSLHRAQKREMQLLLAAALGVVLYVYDLWYGKPGLTLAYVLSLAVYLVLAGVAWQRTVVCTLVAIVCADLLQFRYALLNVGDFAARYLWPSVTLADSGSPGIQFPQVWSTIGEARTLRWVEVLQRTMGRVEVAVLGLAGFVVLALRRWRPMVALAPVIALGLLALVSSRRFVFYLAPLVGIGLGVVITLASTYAARFLAQRKGSATDSTREALPRSPRERSALPSGKLPVELTYVAVVVVFAGLLWPFSASRTYVPPPAIPAPVFHDLQRLAKQVPANARIWTWWDAGFAIVDATGLGVYHDGAAQYTPQTNLVAASFVSADPRLMHGLIGFVDREGNRGIRRLESGVRSFGELVALAGDSARGDAEVPIYVLFTADMPAKFQALRTLGLPDPTRARGGIGMELLPCRQIVNEKVECAGGAVDLRSGIVSRTPPGGTTVHTPLRRAIVVNAGRVERERDYRADAALSVEIVMQGDVARAVYLLDDVAFESNLNQMFMLGRFDPARFEEVLNDFPYARAFRVLPARR